jgi:aldehyde:ferredoxin oxidoreductase
LSKDDPEKGDVLNPRYHNEPCRRGAPEVVGRVIEKDKFIKMRAECYGHKGWDENGVPKPETLKRLGIDNEPSHLV